MLSRLSFLLAMFVLMLASPPPGLAQDLESKPDKRLFSLKTDDREPLFGDRFTLKAGYKVWVAHWQAQMSTSPTANPQSSTDHPAALTGPTVTGILKLRDSQWFNAMVFNFTWLHDHKIDFAEQQYSGSHFLATRRDYSLTAGLTIFEGFGVFAGYYNSRQEITNRPNDPTLAAVNFPRHMSGPIVGVFGTVPVSERVSFYGNLAYAQFKYRGACFVANFCADTKAAQGWVNEVGVTVQGPRVWKIGTEVQAGFRAQIIRKDFGANATGSGTASQTNQLPLYDLTYGPIFSINAVF